MPPITKIWLSTLKTKDSIDPSEFTDLLCHILTHCSSYTNPDSNPKLPPMHAFFRSVESPDNLLMITGYPSQDMNNEADRTYAEAFLPLAPPAPSARLELRMREQRRLRLLAKDGGEAVFNRKVVRAVTAELSFDCYWAEA
ncbi:hypothetical protein BDV27DRAFT_155747 [Aspergillus caelatus]|uniref:Uncharacterized protein n=1 Tax=Aspergillus caelatus TaxID=61420 RepID=A0A5N7A9Q8_9EURO|nr:uncharacterized protein BDV27DRAFT_155747 [Aspergillus caelatus]KAE8366607.1 hypothetical protein BDV27DRAFT_155747 [Aspergillus caelatus]